jgi:hypothetical protein
MKPISRYMQPLSMALLLFAGFFIKNLWAGENGPSYKCNDMNDQCIGIMSWIKNYYRLPTSMENKPEPPLYIIQQLPSKGSNPLPHISRPWFKERDDYRFPASIANECAQAEEHEPSAIKQLPPKGSNPWYKTLYSYLGETSSIIKEKLSGKNKRSKATESSFDATYGSEKQCPDDLCRQMNSILVPVVAEGSKVRLSTSEDIRDGWSDEKKSPIDYFLKFSDIFEKIVEKEGATCAINQPFSFDQINKMHADTELKLLREAYTILSNAADVLEYGSDVYDETIRKIEKRYKKSDCSESFGNEACTVMEDNLNGLKLGNDLLQVNRMRAKELSNSLIWKRMKALADVQNDMEKSQKCDSFDIQEGGKRTNEAITDDSIQNLKKGGKLSKHKDRLKKRPTGNEQWDMFKRHSEEPAE